MEILCFFAGIAFVYTKSVYPLLITIASIFFRPKSSVSVILWFLFAVIWGLTHLYWVRDVGMPNARVITKATIKGSIVSLPIRSSSKTQFEFAIDQLNQSNVKATALISCYRYCPVFKAGQTWSLEVKLRRPTNLANPGHFDFVGGLESRHIHWTGYIKHTIQLHNTVNNQLFLLTFREKLAALLGESILNTSVLGILQALTLGVTTNIDKAHWDLFRRTGTTHLMVISGSHIGLVLGFSYWIMRWLWSRSNRLCLLCPAAKIATAVGMLVGLSYALLAGFAPPSQRSLIACFFLLFRNFANYRFTVWQAWRYGLLAVLLYEPHDVLLPGFYLSFIAVAILILMNQRLTAAGLIKKAIGIQLACLLGLMPLSLFWFSYGSISGLLANALAIPWVGFVIVPLSLVTLFLLQFFNSSFFIIPVKKSIEWLLYFLKWVDSFSFLNLDFSLNGLLSPLALMLVMLIVLFIPIKTIFPAAAVLFVSALFPAYQRIAPGDVKISILDVGQGLSVVVTTTKHTLIYDTGMKFYEGGDMGKLAIIPYLKTIGINKIDAVVISHPDLDHRGGLASLEQSYKIAELLVDNVSFYHRGKNCHHYPTWEWDGVTFRFLAIEEQFRDKNNRSCVLQIKNGVGKILLTGDIEKLAENYLLSHYPDELHSDVLLLPHHGSKTSSSYAFIRQVAPQYAIISSGLDNRYHFPHQQTLKTLKKQKIMIYNTAECGMVSVELYERNNIITPTCYKKVGN